MPAHKCDFCCFFWDFFKCPKKQRRFLKRMGYAMPTICCSMGWIYILRMITKDTVNLHIHGPLWQTVGHLFSLLLGQGPAQLCHQGSNSLLLRQVAHRKSKCIVPPLGIFTRPLWPWNDLKFGQNILWTHICDHEFFDGRFITKSWLKNCNSEILFLVRQER